MAQIDEIKKQRLDTVKKMRDKGMHPYVSKFNKKHTIAEALESEGKTVQTAGQVRSIRTHGNIAFADLRDPTGSIQIFFKKDTLGKENYKDIKLIDTGDYIGVKGEVGKTKAGELSVIPEEYTILTKAILPMPDDFYGLKDVETRYRKRYLDLLVNEDVREVFEVRSRVVTLFREFLDEHGFMEVETPVLQPLYGGTTAKPFITHHNALDADFYLRIATELYLKRLMVGGYEKVYEIGKDFRNEGFSRAHNPEFTMLEFYWAYADYNDLMEFTEKMLTHIIKEVHGSLKVEFEGETYDFATPWERVTFRDLLKDNLDIDINEIDTEEKLSQVIDDRNLLDEDVVGYGLMLDEVYKKHIRPNIKGPMFLIDQPVELTPLAKRKEDDPTKSAAFQLLVDGMEFINAYNELNDPIDQRDRWLEDMDAGERGAEEYQVLDEDYIEALSYGMPPTAGWGLGIDRFVAFLTDQHSIKDVILFPTMKPMDMIDGADTHAPKSSQTSKPKKPSQKQSSQERDTNLTLSREDAIQILNDHIKNKNLVNHGIAVGEVMRVLAEKLDGNPDLWELVGILHDADWEETQDDPSMHTRKTIEWIKEAGENNQLLIDGILTHNYKHNGYREPQTNMEWALYTCDELTGFIVAVALVRPDKKLASVDTQSVLKKFPAKSFAKPVDREQIKMCEEKLDIPLEEFVTITLNAMQGISDDLGL